MGNPDFPFVTHKVFFFLNMLNLMIFIFSCKLIKTDFLGGWKKSKGEYATDVSAYGRKVGVKMEQNIDPDAKVAL